MRWCSLLLQIWLVALVVSLFTEVLPLMRGYERESFSLKVWNSHIHPLERTCRMAYEGFFNRTSTRLSNWARRWKLSS